MIVDPKVRFINPGNGVYIPISVGITEYIQCVQRELKKHAKSEMKETQPDKTQGSPVDPIHNHGGF